MKTNLFILVLILMTYSACNQSSKSIDASNPFFTEFSTPYSVPPFDRMKAEHYKPAFLKGMELHAEEIEVITNNPDKPTFENTVVAMDESGSLLNRVAGVFYAMTSAMSDTVLQAIESELSPLMTIKIGGQYMNEVEYCHVKDYEIPVLPPTNPGNDYGAYKGSAQNHHFVIENVVNVLKNKGEEITTNARDGYKVVDIIERMMK
jgi:hypothetical protein